MLLQISVPLKAVVADLWERLLPKRRTLARLRACWGQPGTRVNLFADGHFELTRGAAGNGCVDDKTWSDLELPRVFADMDATVSPIGSQMLFSRLRTYSRRAGKCAAYDALGTDAGLRERVQWILSSLSDDGFAEVADLLFGEMPEPVRHQSLLWIWALVSIVVLASAITGTAPVWAAFGVVCVNAGIVLRGSSRMRRDAERLALCMKLLAAADRLGAMSARSPTIPQLAELAERKTQRARAQQALRWMFALKRPPINWLSVWMTLAFLAEPLAYLVSMRGFMRARAVLVSTFELVGSLDADIAVASYLAYRPDHCRPELIDAPALDIRDGCHPLIAAPVKNSFHLDEARSALIVGSNMAGKTTFIKMIGINIILARTLGFCLASRATVPRVKVMASIRNDHSVASGKSHYLAEMETIRSFVQDSDSVERYFFLIDELFRGTNTVERIAAARAVLETMGQHAQVLVTTHDVELQAPLSFRYDLYHFREAPDVKGFFDYRLRSGMASERNAIRLLGRMGFPGELVDRAMAYAADGVSAPASVREPG